MAGSNACVYKCSQPGTQRARGFAAARGKPGVSGIDLIVQVFDTGRVTDEEQAAMAAAGVAERHAHLHRISRQEAMAEIRQVLIRCNIAADRAGAVLCEAAAGYLTVHDGRWHAERALQVLLDAGADLQQAKTIKTERDARRLALAPPGQLTTAGR
jgi:hypothetical protein